MTSPLATHRIVVCDTFDYEDYSVLVHEDEDLEEIKKQYNNVNMQRIHEVFMIDPPSPCGCYKHW